MCVHCLSFACGPEASKAAVAEYHGFLRILEKSRNYQAGGGPNRLFGSDQNKDMRRKPDEWTS